MNNDNKIVDQAQPQAPVQPVPSVGGGANKEVGRVVAPVSEFVTRSGAEAIPNIPPEVSAHIEVKNDNPTLTEEHKQIGVEYAGPSVQPPTEPSGLVQIPQTTDINNSDTWLNALTEKIQKVMKLLGV